MKYDFAKILKRIQQSSVNVPRIQFVAEPKVSLPLPPPKEAAPPKWDLQEYIVTYLKKQDNRYLAWFLHYYEKTLNNNVQEYMRKLFMPEHFADMKQAYIARLLKALKNYDIKQGAPFTSFKERYVEREILDYVRSMRTGFTAQSIAEYAKLRKAMAILYKYERDYSDETLIKVAGELEETV